MRGSFPLVLGVLLLVAGRTAAGPTDAAKCYADKLKRAGLYSKCRIIAESKLAKTEGVCSFQFIPCFYHGECLVPGETCEKDLTKYDTMMTKCDMKISDKFAKAEAKWGIECPTTSDLPYIQAQVTEDTDSLAVRLAGGSPPDLGCGNGIVETGESCDGLDFDGNSCGSLGYGVGYNLACTYECRLDTSACEAPGLPSRFRDNGDGTATDIVSGLIWELKDSAGGGASLCPGGATCGNAHDVDNGYSWSDSFSSVIDGSAKTEFLDVLNDVAGGGASCFAGYCDWRLPSVMELRSLLPSQNAFVGNCAVAPCVDPDLPGETASNYYWSSTNQPSFVGEAWWVNFSNGEASSAYPAKYELLNVRAVRGGVW